MRTIGLSRESRGLGVGEDYPRHDEHTGEGGGIGFVPTAFVSVGSLADNTIPRCIHSDNFTPCLLLVQP